MRLNIGCGPNPPEGWVNIDRDDHGQDHVVDVRLGLPFAGQTFDEVQTHHVLHMMSVPEVRALLAEIYRVTKDGGVLRISDRDPIAGIDAFNRGGAWLLELVADEVEPTLPGKLCRWLTWHGTTRSLLLEDRLDSILVVGGWRHVRHLRYQHSLHHAEVSLDSRPEESFFIEAVR